MSTDTLRKVRHDLSANAVWNHAQRQKHVQAIESAFTDQQTPNPVPPIMIAGSGDRLLTLAAEEADIIAIATLGTETELSERVDFVRREAGERFDDIELAFGFFQTSLDDPTDVRIIELLTSEASDAERRAMATVLDGSVAAAAERIHRMRDMLGISYFQFSVVTDSTSTSFDTFEKLLTAAHDRH